MSDTDVIEPGAETPPATEPPPPATEAPPPVAETPPARPLPKRLAVIVALQNLLSKISTADGDKFTLAGKVYRNRVLLGAEVTERPPILAILEAPRPDIASFAGDENSYRRDSWTLMIQGIAADNRKDSTDDVYYLCQDVERRLSRIQETKDSGNPKFKDDYMLGGMITSVEIAPPVIRPPEAGVANNAFFYLPIRVGMAAKIGE